MNHLRNCEGNQAEPFRNSEKNPKTPTRFPLLEKHSGLKSNHLNIYHWTFLLAQHLPFQNSLRSYPAQHFSKFLFIGVKKGFQGSVNPGKTLKARTLTC